jgi:hypothetical protein
LSSLFPNFQGQGPFGSAVRIALKLQQRLWAKSTFGHLGNKKRREDEIRGKAVKVKDLLQHSAELGNEQALYKLAHISMVCHKSRKVRFAAQCYPPVSPKLLFSFRPCPCIHVFRLARLSHWKCLLTSLCCIFPCNGLPWGGPCESSQSPVVLYICRTIG